MVLGNIVSYFSNDTLILSQNSISRIEDSVSKINLADTDLLSRRLSTKIDAIHAINHLEGFEGILHPSSPQTENWVIVLLIVLLSILLVFLSQHPSFITENIQNFFKIKIDKYRTNIETSYSFFYFFIFLFSIGVFSLYAYILFSNPSEGFLFSRYFYFCGITFAFFILKYIFIQLIGFVFFEPNIFTVLKANYFNTFYFFNIILFFLVILQIYFPVYDIKWTLYFALILGILALTSIVIKLLKIFSQKKFVYFYILLYLCTLEILPLIALFRIYQLMY
ncbi:MAG: DUF4271 domain-containing protein [Paludibacteraceae bacterium]|nr:DUF4271 domain-containing protein [Paludibacteraceae bacterium]